MLAFYLGMIGAMLGGFLFLGLLSVVVRKDAVPVRIESPNLGLPPRRLNYWEAGGHYF
jgi:hypothetical protein